MKHNHLNKVKEFALRFPISESDINLAYWAMYDYNPDFRKLTEEDRWKFMESSFELSLETGRDHKIVMHEQWHRREEKEPLDVWIEKNAEDLEAHIGCHIEEILVPSIAEELKRLILISVRHWYEERHSELVKIMEHGKKHVSVKIVDEEK